MIALAELHNLIKSLNKPEKRFFKLLSATEKNDVTKAIALFDFIEKTNDNEDVYYKSDNEKKIDVSISNLKALYTLILKSQRNFYSESITGFNLNDELANLKILFEKAQFKQCKKMIKALKENAIANEKFNYLLEIIELEKELLKIDFFEADYETEYAKLLEQQQSLIEQEKNVGQYYQLYSQLKFQIKNNNLNGEPTPLSYYENFLNEDFILFEKNASSKKSYLLLLKCRALCYTSLKKQDLRCAQLIEIKTFLNQNPFLFDEMPRQYIDVLYNLANAYIEINQLGKAKMILNEMYEIVNSKKVIGLDLAIKLQSHAYTIELLILTYTAKYKEGAELAISISEFISANESIFNKEDKSVLLYNLINFYIYNSNFELAERTIAQLRNESDKKARWDLKCYSRIQELVVCLELKQFSKIPLIISILKTLIKEKVFTSSIEIKFIAFFEVLSNKEINTLSDKKFKAFHNELKSLLNTRNDSWTNYFYFNFYAYTGYRCGAGEMKDLVFETFNQNEINFSQTLFNIKANPQK
jgi:hypothetical protein